MKEKMRHFVAKRRKEMKLEKHIQSPGQRGVPRPIEIEVGLLGSSVEVKDISDDDVGADEIGAGWSFGESSSNNSAVRYNPCTEAYLEEYLRNPAVKEALHVKSSITWESCNDVIFTNWPDSDFFYRNTSYIYGQLRELNKLKILVFSGNDLYDACGNNDANSS
jgi:hypothetical protein